MPAEYLGACLLPQKPAAVRWSSCNGADADGDGSGDGSGVFLVSTYELSGENANTSKYDGCLYVIKDHQIAQQIAMPNGGGIFRFEKHPNKHNCWIAALTNGHLGVIDLSSSSIVTNLRVTVEKRILMSVSISTQNDEVLTSDECGYVHILDLNLGDVKQSFQAHRLPFSSNQKCEVWDVCWLNEHLIASGADDGLLKLWDRRAYEKPIAICKEHSSGVVCLQREHDGTHLLSGSYDERIRRFDIRFLQHSCNKMNLGGGVWAIERCFGNGHDNLLVSCMYNGWCLVDSADFTILESNRSLGENLLYGASVDPNSHTIASTTFNDYRINFEKLHDFS